MVSGTTAMLAPMAAFSAPSSISCVVALASAGWALSILSADVISSMPPPTWKLAKLMLKKSRMCRPIKALPAMTANALKVETTMVLCFCSAVNPWV